MTENNKLFNALDQLQLNTNNNDLKALEKEIFAKENLKNIKANEGSDLYDFLNGTDIKKIINNGHQIEDGIIISFYTRFLPTAKFHILHVPGHYKTADEKNNEIFDSVEDGRQLNNCCGIHALEGVLIAEALTEKGKNIKEFKAKHNNQLVKTLEDDLIEQRKILFKMEILDALNNLPETVLGTVYSKKEDGTYEINGLSKLYKLYFEEFQARCAALQAVKKELGLELDKVKLDKEAPEVQKVEAQGQSIPTAPQQIKQKREIKTAVQPTTRIVIEEQTNIQQQKENKLKYGTPIVKNEEGKNDKKFNLPSEPKKESEIVNTQEVIEEEPNPSMDSQNSKISTTSSILSEHPKMKLGTVYNWKEEKDTGIETYDIKNNKIDNINEKAAQLYLDILMQVLNETNKENGLEEITEEKITAIKNKTEEKIDACFTIRDENNNIIENLTKEDKEDLELARTDYKNRARVDERVSDIFDMLEKLKNCQGAAKEIQEKLLQQQAIASKE